MGAVGNGILFGLLLTVMVGPVFFALIQNSIQKGYWGGFLMAIGISLSDTIYIVLAYFGISYVNHNPLFNVMLGVIGGSIMLVFGVVSIVKPTVYHEQKENIPSYNPVRQVIKGFMLNGINPFVLLFWIGVVSLVTLNYHYDGEEAFIFFTTIIVTVFSTDNLKSFLSQRLRRFINTYRMKVMNRIVGIALVLFSLRLFYYAFTHWSAIAG